MLRSTEVALVCGMQLFDTGIWVLAGFVLCVEALFGICLDVCRACPPRGRRDDNKDTSPGFDDKILPVYMRGRSVTTGTPHACVVICRAFDDRYRASSVRVFVRESAIERLRVLYIVLSPPTS